MVEQTTAVTESPAKDRPAHKFDVFISYSHEDARWVREWLLPRLRQADLSVCIDFEAFDVGVTAVENMEGAVECSRQTLLVLTPAYLRSDWAKFESILSLDHWRLVPVLFAECDLPPRFKYVTYANFTGGADPERELRRVLDAVRGVRHLASDAPVQIVPPDKASAGGGSPPAFPRPGAPAGRAFDAVADLLHTPEAYAAMVQYRSSFETARKQIYMVSDYKDLHDELDELQKHCYDPLVRLWNVPNLLEVVADHTYDLDDVTEKIGAIVKRGHVADQEHLASSLKRTGATFQEAVDHMDLEKLKAVKKQLQRTLEESTTLNRLICHEARQLNLTVLIESLASVWKRIAESGADSSKLQIIEESVPELRQLDADRVRLVEAHNSWQLIDDDLRMVEIQLRATPDDLSELEDVWPDVKDALQKQCAGREEEWAQKLTESVQRLDAALASEDPGQTRAAFDSLRRQAKQRFHGVDNELLKLCGERLRPLGDKLQTVLAVIG